MSAQPTPERRTWARRTLLVECSYLGRYFYGVQPQPGFRTVAGELRQMFADVTGLAVRGLTFAARTDAGVDALCNYATCWYRGPALTPQQVARLTAPSNSALRIATVRDVPRRMNARASSSAKHYRYQIRPSVPPPMPDHRASDGAWCVACPLSRRAMQTAAYALQGTHDFSTFRARDCDANNPVKTIYGINVTEHGNRLWVDVEGSAFLRKMVRILVGTLAEVGAGLRPADSMEALLAAKDRQRAGLAAPAHGLSLISMKLLWPNMRHAGMPLLRAAF